MEGANKHSTPNLRKQILLPTHQQVYKIFGSKEVDTNRGNASCKGRDDNTSCFSFGGKCELYILERFAASQS